MSELDTQLAALAAAANAQAAALIAAAKAKENAATFTTSLLTPDELSASAANYDAAIGRSQPHAAVPELYAMVKHLFAVVATLRADLGDTDTTIASGYTDQVTSDQAAAAAASTTTQAPASGLVTATT